MDKIKEVLEYDTLYEAEKLFGKDDYHNFNKEEMRSSLLLHILHNQKKESILKEAHDTHFSMTWDEFTEIITSNGFKSGYENKFPYEDREEKEAMFYRDDGLVIWVTSYGNMSRINSGSLYGEIKLNDKQDRKNIPSYSNMFYDYDNCKLTFETDIREGLIWFINQMQNCGTFLPQWEEEDKFLWLLNYGPDEKENEIKHNYSEISRNKMELFCDDAKKIVQKYIRKELDSEMELD